MIPVIFLLIIWWTHRAILLELIIFTIKLGNTSIGIPSLILFLISIILGEFLPITNGILTKLYLSFSNFNNLFSIFILKYPNLLFENVLSNS